MLRPVVDVDVDVGAEVVPVELMTVVDDEVLDVDVVVVVGGAPISGRH
jgi:hypothetical protein